MLSDPATRIFVVDDEPVIASTLATILQMNGFSAAFFTSPLEALTAARSKAPDLLISDVTMPSISGIELAIKMRAQYPKCRILLFSGHPATLALLEVARAQGHEFHLLLKPVPPAEFLLEVGKMVEATVPNPAGLARPLVPARRAILTTHANIAVAAGKRAKFRPKAVNFDLTRDSRQG